jgi:hypothetical protein
MSTFPIKIQSDLNLKELALKCATLQNAAICKLVHLAAKDEGGNKFNVGLFAEVNLTDVAPDPTLVEVKSGVTKASIITEQLAKGKFQIFDELVYVENQKIPVLGFL